VTAPSVARIILIGEISKVERKTVGDSPLAEFYLDGFGLRIAAWKDLATLPAVGMNVMVEGAVKTRQYQVEGKDRQTTEITASSVVNLGAPAQQAAPVSAPAPVATGAVLPDGGF
jgi:hypothetical protein